MRTTRLTIPGQIGRHYAGHSLPARNRLTSVVLSVEIAGVIALAEIEAGFHRITAALETIVGRAAVRGIGKLL